jgi:hypothetical protein
MQADGCADDVHRIFIAMADSVLPERSKTAYENINASRVVGRSKVCNSKIPPPMAEVGLAVV